MCFQFHNLKKKCQASGLACVDSERQALNGSPAPLRLRSLASSQAAAKKRWNPLAGNFPVSVTVSCLSVFVMEIEDAYRKNACAFSSFSLSQTSNILSMNGTC